MPQRSKNLPWIPKLVTRIFPGGKKCEKVSHGQIFW